MSLRPVLTVLVASVASAALVLAGQAPGVASAHASASLAHKPPVKVRTYVVTYTLTGTYHSTETYDEDEGFCNGTSSAEAANFSESSTGRLTLTIDKAGQYGFKPSVAKTGSLGEWAGKTEAVAEGDPCSSIVEHSCTGGVTGEKGSTGTGVEVATTASKVVFDSLLTDVPDEAMQASDCASDGYYPGLALHLHPALSPYDDVRVSLTWARLKNIAVGSSLKLTAAYTDKPDGYNLATCNGEPHCTGRLSSFVHTITLKRTR